MQDRKVGGPPFKVVLPPLVFPCQLTTARTRCASQTIIEVEAESVDASTSGEGRQARLLIVERGPALEEKIVPESLVNLCIFQRGLKGIVSLLELADNAAEAE